MLKQMKMGKSGSKTASVIRVQKEAAGSSRDSKTGTEAATAVVSAASVIPPAPALSFTSLPASSCFTQSSNRLVQLTDLAERASSTRRRDSSQQSCSPHWQQQRQQQSTCSDQSILLQILSEHRSCQLLADHESRVLSVTSDGTANTANQMYSLAVQQALASLLLWRANGNSTAAANATTITTASAPGVTAAARRQQQQQEYLIQEILTKQNTLTHRQRQEEQQDAALRMAILAWRAKNHYGQYRRQSNK